MSKDHHFSKHKQYYHASPGLNPDFWPGIPAKERWTILTKSLQKTSEQESFTLHSVVMMSTHVHILYSTQPTRENFTMESLQRNLRCLLELNFYQDPLESPLYSEKITSYKQLLYTYRYIYRNPIEAGLCLRAENYSYSSLPEILGKKQNTCECLDPVHLIQNPVKILNWINEDENLRLFRDAIR
jgi:REP element-mobilizing transposase RayT